MLLLLLFLDEQRRAHTLLCLISRRFYVLHLILIASDRKFQRRLFASHLSTEFSIPIVIIRKIAFEQQCGFNLFTSIQNIEQKNLAFTADSSTMVFPLRVISPVTFVNSLISNSISLSEWYDAVISGPQEIEFPTYPEIFAVAFLRTQRHLPHSNQDWTPLLLLRNQKGSTSHREFEKWLLDEE